MAVYLRTPANAVRARPFHPGGAGPLVGLSAVSVRHHRASGMDGAQSFSGSTAPLSMIPTLPPGVASVWEKELDRAKDDAAVLIRATLAKVAERIQGMDVEDLAVGQIPAALRTLIELELKVLGYEDRVALTGKDGGPVKVEAKTQHVFQPTQEAWDEVVRIRTEFERLQDGDTDEEITSDSL